MNVLKLRRGEFRVARTMIDRATFREWIAQEGKLAQLEVWRGMRARWFFGRRRASRVLYKAARRALDPHTVFALDMAKKLDEFPMIARKLALAIRRRRYRDLYSANGEHVLVVIPRGVVQNDFAAFLVRELAAAPQLEGLPGLARRVLEPIAREAESLMFSSLQRRGGLVDGTGKGALMGVDAGYRWRINGIDGHYYYACTELDLTRRRELKRFRSDMEEFLRAQEIHLRRMRNADRVAVVEEFQTS